MLASEHRRLIDVACSHPGDFVRFGSNLTHGLPVECVLIVAELHISEGFSSGKDCIEVLQRVTEHFVRGGACETLPSGVLRIDRLEESGAAKELESLAHSCEACNGEVLVHWSSCCGDCVLVFFLETIDKRLVYICPDVG